MQKQRILLLNPPNEPFTDPGLLIEPIDILTVASFLQMLGHEVRAVDLDIEQKLPVDIIPTLNSFCPDITVIPFDYHIPLFTAEAIDHAVALAFLASDHGSKVIVGGRPSNRYPDLFLNTAPTAIIVIGEMEGALRELLTLDSWSTAALAKVPGIIYRKDGVITKSAARLTRIDLSELPIPDRSLLPIDKYIDVRSLLSSRGCVERCSFCPVPTFWGKWRARPADLVVDEIEYLVSDFGAKKILFLDDHATVDRQRLKEISREVLRRGIITTLGCLGTVKSVDRETLDLMRAAGFRWIHFGAEVASESLLRGIGKRITPIQIRTAVIAAKAAGLRVRTSWIFDLPGSNLVSLEKSIEMIVETEPDEVRAHFLALRAGAPLANALDTSNVPSQQFIHAGAPHQTLGGVERSTLTKHIEGLVSTLVARGYHAIREAHEWSAKKLEGIRFISFCPGRYGIGWTL